MLLAVNWLSPTDLISTFGTFGLLIVIFVESGLFPAPLPGDSLLVLAGAFAATKEHGQPHLNLAVVTIGAFIVAVVGAEIGYWIGRKYGIRLFKPDARVFKMEYHDRAQEFFERRGAPSVVLARFVPIVRTIVPMVAGTSAHGAPQVLDRERDRRHALGRRRDDARLLDRQVDQDRPLHLPDRRAHHHRVADPTVPRVSQAQEGEGADSEATGWERSAEATQRRGCMTATYPRRVGSRATCSTGSSRGARGSASRCGDQRVLRVRGRKSGEPRTVPVNLLTADGVRYLVAPRGETQWVRNLRAANGEGELLLGRKVEAFRSTELTDADKPPVLRAYLKRWKAEVGVFFDGVSATSPEEDVARIAPQHPVFRLEP